MFSILNSETDNLKEELDVLHLFITVPYKFNALIETCSVLQLNYFPCHTIIEHYSTPFVKTILRIQ